MQQVNNKSTGVIDQGVESYKPGPRKKAFWLGLAIIAVVAVAALVWVFWGLKGREAEFEATLQKRLDLMSGAQVQLTEALLDTAISQANRVINSELFKLYAAEVHLIEDDVSLLVAGTQPGAEPQGNAEISQLAAQLPMMQNLLIEFTRVADYLAGRVINRNGTVYLATDATTTPLRVDQQALVKAVLQSQVPQFGPLRHTNSGLVLEAYLPIFPPEASGLDKTPVAVLLLSKVVGKRLVEMRNSSLLDEGERIRWVQKTPDGYQEVVPWLPGQLQNINTPLALDAKDRLPFAVRPALGGEQKVYSVGLPVAGPDWWVVVEADYGIAREPLREQQRALLSIAGLLVLFFGVTFGAVWASLVSHQDRRVARHFEQLATQLEKQRQLLDNVNSNIEDYIVQKDLQGRYQYVNPAFARAVGRAAEELIGLDNEAVFGYDTARRLEHSDQQVLSTKEPVTFSETVFLQSKPHHLQIAKSPLKDDQENVIGIVSVIRDVTDIVNVQRRQEQAKQKTVEALVRAIELTDPYLAGHSRLMRDLSVEVAKGLNASDMDIATVETAAYLSQIGKLFVERDLLFKTEPLTEDEKRKMEEHVVHAGKVLKGIDFGLPVYEAVCQMNESPDGSGYPNGLKGDAIHFVARVLGVTNSFCAMVEPRAYRGARTVEETLRILVEAGSAYDQKVVDALREVVGSAVGDKLLARHAPPD